MRSFHTCRLFSGRFNGCKMYSAEVQTGTDNPVSEEFSTGTEKDLATILPVMSASEILRLELSAHFLFPVFTGIN